jgi:hypothetical protein
MYEQFAHFMCTYHSAHEMEVQREGQIRSSEWDFGEIS